MKRWTLPPCLLLIGLLAPPTAAQAKHAIVIQESNGFPGGEKARKLARQKVVIKGKHLQVTDRQHAWAMWVDIKKEQVWEADLVKREKAMRPFSYYEKYRRERRETLAKKAREFKRGLKLREDNRRKKRKWIRRYTEDGGDPRNPGAINARLQWYPGDKKRVLIKVDGVDREVTLHRYVIRENQARKPVFDLWLTKDVSLPVNMVQFYRQLGTFSKAVTDVLLQVPKKGTIINCTAILDTGSVHKTFRSRILEIRTKEALRREPVPPSDEILKPVDPDDRPKVDPGAGEVTCSLSSCSKKIEKRAAVRFVDPFTNRAQYVCSKEHRHALLRERAKKKKKRGGGG